MFENYIKKIKLKNKRIEVIQFDWGIEDRPFFEKINALPVDLAIFWSDRFSPLESLFVEGAVCRLFEEANSISPNYNVKATRALVTEAQRVLWSLDYFSNCFELLNDSFRLQQIRFLFEKYLNFQEVITGARVLPQFFTLGGTRRKLSLGDLNKLRQLVVDTEKVMDGVFDSYQYDERMIEWLSSSMIFPLDWVNELKLGGFHLDSHGLKCDLRLKEEPFSNLTFNQLEKESFCKNGSAWSRMQAVLFGLKNSLFLINQVLKEVESGKELDSFGGLTIEQTGEWRCVVEAPSGDLQASLIDGKLGLSSASIRLTPKIEELLRDTEINEWELFLATLGFNFSQACFYEKN